MNCWTCNKTLSEPHICYFCGADQKLDISTSKPSDYAQRIAEVDRLVMAIGEKVRLDKLQQEKR